MATEQKIDGNLPCVCHSVSVCVCWNTYTYMHALTEKTRFLNQEHSLYIICF